MTRAFLLTAILASISWSRLHADEADKLDLAAAAELADLLARVKDFSAKIEKTKAILDSPNPVETLTNDPAAREFLLVTAKEYLAPAIDAASRSALVRDYFALKDKIATVKEEIATIQTKLADAKQAATLAKTELTNAISLVNSYTALKTQSARLLFVVTFLKPALETPVEIDMGDQTKIKIQVLGAGEQLLAAAGTSKLALRIIYGSSGLAARIDGVAISQDGKLDFSKIRPSPDSSSMQAAVRQLLGKALEGISLPLPITIEKIDQFLDGGLPNLSVSISAQVPGLDALESAGLKLQASFVITPAINKPLSEQVKLKGDLCAQIPSEPIPIGTGLQLSVKTVCISKDNQKLTIDGLITPVGEPDGSTVALSLTVGLDMKGAPAITLQGQFNVLKQPIGDFQSTLSNKGLSGVLTIPAKTSLPVLGNVFQGKFSFKLDQDALTADGMAKLFDVMRSNFALYLSLRGGDSTFTSKDRLNIFGINAESNISATLTDRYRKFSMNATMWTEVDLLVCRPTARIDIAVKGDTSNPVPPEVVNVQATALGITVSWEPDSKSLTNISLADIERRLRTQLPNMLNRVSAAAAAWEKDKRELLSAWERHWSDTLSAEAKKRHLDKIDVDGKDGPINKLLGRMASGGKEWISDVSHGMSDEWNRGRESAGKFVDGLGEVLKLPKIGRRAEEGNKLAFVLHHADDPVQPASDSQAALKQILNQMQVRSQSASGLSDVSGIAKAIKTQITDVDVLKKVAGAMKAQFGAMGYGGKLENALLGMPFSDPTSDEVTTARNIVSATQFWIPTVPGPVKNQATLDTLASNLESISILKERQNGPTSRQAHISVSDVAWLSSDDQTRNITMIVRVAGFRRDPQGTVTASNLVPVVVVVRSKGKNGADLEAEIQDFDVSKVNDEQLKWLREWPPGKDYGADGGIPSTPELAQQALRDVFVVDRIVEAKDSDRFGLEVNRLVRNAIQSEIERTIPKIAISGTKAQYERQIYLQNQTSEDLLVKIQVRQRTVRDNEFRWEWTTFDGRDYLEVRIPAGPGTVKEVSLETSNSPDDFSASGPILTASRIRIEARGMKTGERWGSWSDDVFAVDRDWQLGGDRSYSAPVMDKYVYVVQSRSVPPVSVVSLFQAETAVIQHRGPAPRLFFIPAKSSDVQSILQSLVVERVQLNGRDGKSRYSDYLGWEASVGSVKQFFAGDAGGAEQVVVVNLTPRSKRQDADPTSTQLTEEIAVRYRIPSLPWSVVYRLAGKADNTELLGSYQFKNSTVCPWEVAQVNLFSGVLPSRIEDVTGPVASFTGIKLVQGSTGLSSQSGTVMPIDVESYLMFREGIDKTHPRRLLRIAVAKDEKRRFPGGALFLGKTSPIAGPSIETMTPGEQQIIPAPDEVEKRVKISRTAHEPVIEHQILSIKGNTLEYRPWRRTVYFHVDPGEWRARTKAVVGLFASAEDGWREGQKEVALTDKPAKLSVDQFRMEAGDIKKVNVFADPLEFLKELRFRKEEPRYAVWRKLVEWREKEDFESMRVFLLRPELEVQDVTVRGESHPGKKIHINVKIRNLGGNPARFQREQRVLAAPGFKDVFVADEDLTIAPLGHVVLQMETNRPATAGAFDISVSLDPDNAVALYSLPPTTRTVHVVP